MTRYWIVNSNVEHEVARNLVFDTSGRYYGADEDPNGWLSDPNNAPDSFAYSDGTLRIAAAYGPDRYVSTAYHPTSEDSRIDVRPGDTIRIAAHVVQCLPGNRPSIGLEYSFEVGGGGSIGGGSGASDTFTGGYIATIVTVPANVSSVGVVVGARAHHGEENDIDVVFRDVTLTVGRYLEGELDSGSRLNTFDGDSLGVGSLFRVAWDGEPNNSTSTLYRVKRKDRLRLNSVDGSPSVGSTLDLDLVWGRSYSTFDVKEIEAIQHNFSTLVEDREGVPNGTINYIRNPTLNPNLGITITPHTQIVPWSTFLLVAQSEGIYVSQESKSGSRGTQLSTKTLRI